MSTTPSTRRWLPLLLALAVLAPAPAALAGPDDAFPVAPSLNSGQKWRVGYYQGGPYGNYRETLIGMTRGLIQLGWVHPGEPPPSDDPEDAESVWRWLAEPGRSDHIEFVADAFYDAGWDDARRASTRTALVERLGPARDIDMVLAMGTWAGRDLAVDGHSTPTIVLSTSDAVKAKIIASVEDSGRDNLHAHVDPNRFGRQISVFHEIVGFRRLGIVYQDSVEGRSYSGIGLARDVATQRGFELVRCMLRGDFGDEPRAEPTVVGCFELLAPHVDAIYVVSQTGLNERTVPRLIEIANEHRVPTFAQHGAGDVRKGMLLSMTRKNFDGVGLFHASVAAKIFNGASPRRLDQVFEEESRITINVETASRIGFVPPPRLLSSADIVGEAAAANEVTGLTAPADAGTGSSVRSSRRASQ